MGDVFSAFILGIVEGVTEFLPVSSTGHLILVGDMLAFTGEMAKTFEIFIQLGAILAVVWLYRAKLASTIRDVRNPDTNGLAIKLLIAFLPSLVAGLIAHPYIKHYLFNTKTVAMALIGGGLAILLIEWATKKVVVRDLDAIPYRLALGVGIFQVLSLFPGVSRAGATIMGGILLGLERRVAVEFSFFLAIPTMFAATSFDLAKGISHLHVVDIPIFITGFITAFVVAILVIKAFLKFVARHNFTPFGYYRIAFGSIVLLYYLS